MSCLNDADEVGASPESPADTDSNNGNNNLHDSDHEILLDITFKLAEDLHIAGKRLILRKRR